MLMWVLHRVLWVVGHLILFMSFKMKFTLVENIDSAILKYYMNIKRFPNAPYFLSKSETHIQFLCEFKKSQYGEPLGLPSVVNYVNMNRLVVITRQLMWALLVDDPKYTKNSLKEAVIIALNKLKKIIIPQL